MVGVCGRGKVTGAERERGREGIGERRVEGAHMVNELRENAQGGPYHVPFAVGKTSITEGCLKSLITSRPHRRTPPSSCATAALPSEGIK